MKDKDFYKELKETLEVNFYPMNAHSLVLYNEVKKRFKKCVKKQQKDNELVILWNRGEEDEKRLFKND